MFALGTHPAKAAGLGGDCCADFEQRVAELEATTSARAMIAHGPLVRHLLHAILLQDVRQRVDAGREAAVQAEDLLLDQSRQRK